MFPAKLCLLLVPTIIVCSESAYVDNLQKCKIDDADCQTYAMQNVIRKIAKTGVPELELPLIDPIKLQNVTISAADLIELIIVDGTVKGIKDCVVDKFFTDMKTKRIIMELTTDVIIKAHYKVFSNSPLIKSFFGGETVHGDGNMKVKMNKIHIRFDYLFYIQKRPDDIYINFTKDKSVYKYDFLGNMTFFLDNIYLGKEESSQIISTLLNQNWKLLVTPFGKPFMDKAKEIVYEFFNKFFDKVPVKYYILDDLSKYARE